MPNELTGAVATFITSVGGGGGAGHTERTERGSVGCHFVFVSLVAQAVQRDPVSGAYLIFYMGSTDNGTVKTGGGKCADKPETQSLCNQRVGLAYSMSPNGWVSTSLSRRLLMPAKDLNSSRWCFASTRSMIDCLVPAPAAHTNHIITAPSFNLRTS